MNNKLKTAIILTLLVVATGSFTYAAKLRLNNNTGVSGTGVYATFALAYGAANNNDTIIIEGSNTSYGDMTIAKPLTIFGPGFLLNENTQTQASLLTANIGIVTYNVGSQGSLISGCKINSITVNADNITIARNFIKNSTLTSTTILLNGDTQNTIIQQNIVWGLITNTAGKHPEVVIRNNLLGRIIFTIDMTYVHIINNTIVYDYCSNAYYGYGANARGIDVYNATITNNIITHSDLGSWGYYGSLIFETGRNNNVSYNIFTQADPGGALSGTSNYYSTTMTNEFLNSGTGEVDKNYLIKGGGNADNNGLTGSEIGMFGGEFIYVLSGLPPIPHIYFLDADPAGTNTDPLNVKISVKSQN